MTATHAHIWFDDWEHKASIPISDMHHSETQISVCLPADNPLAQWMTEGEGRYSYLTIDVRHRWRWFGRFQEFEIRRTASGLTEVAITWQGFECPVMPIDLPIGAQVPPPA